MIQIIMILEVNRYYTTGTTSIGILGSGSEWNVL